MKARPDQRWVGEPISLSLKNADLTEVLRTFARLTDTNLVIDPAVRGEVTVELKDVPWDQALWVILKTHGLGLEILRLIGLRDPRMPEGGLLSGAAMPVRSSHPLYRADTGGREFAADGEVVTLPFTLLGSGGFAPTLDEEVMRRLAELGYAAEDGQ